MPTEPSALQSKETKKSIAPMVFILIGNIAPLIGVLFFNWSVANVIILYWIENLIIGFWTLIKMLTARGFPDKSVSFGATLFMCVFFTVHYGMFCMGHGTFISIILDIPGAGRGFIPVKSMISGGLITTGVLIGTLVMFVNYGISYVKDYILSGEYKNASSHALMFSPYGHIIVVHIAVMIGAGISSFKGSPMWLMLALIIGKTLIELKTTQFKARLREKNLKSPLSPNITS